MLSSCCTKYPVKFKLFSLFVIVCFSFFSSGCAAIVNDSKQMVMLNTDPTGATLFVSGHKVESPASLELRRDKDHFVRAVKEGYKEAKLTIHKRLSKQFWWGFTLWGVFECISFLSSGAYELSLTNINLLLQMESLSPEVEPESEQPTSGTLDTKPLDKIEEELSKLEKMKADGLITDEEYLELRKKTIDKY